MDSDALYQPFPLPTRARGHVWRHRPETRRPRHFHAEPELNLITAGTARFGMGDLAIDVGPGDLLWWPPGQDHVLLDASADFDLFVVGVTPELSDRVLGGDGAAAHAAPARVRLPRDVLAGLQAICAASPHQQDPAAEDPIVIERAGRRPVARRAPGARRVRQPARVDPARADAPARAAGHHARRDRSGHPRGPDRGQPAFSPGHGLDPGRLSHAAAAAALRSGRRRRRAQPDGRGAGCRASAATRSAIARFSRRSVARPGNSSRPICAPRWRTRFRPEKSVRDSVKLFS